MNSNQLSFPISARYMPQTGLKENTSSINLIHHDNAVRDIITRTYGCPITKLHSSPNVSTNASSYEPHANVLSACVAIETNSTFYILHVGVLSIGPLTIIANRINIRFISCFRKQPPAIRFKIASILAPRFSEIIITSRCSSLINCYT